MSVPNSSYVPPSAALTSKTLEQRLEDAEALASEHQTNSVVLNPIGDQSIFIGKLSAPVHQSTKLTAATAPTITPTGGAAGAQSYVIVAKFGTVKVPSATGSTAVGPTTLDATHYNTLSWAAYANATGYDVYRVTGGASQGLIASVTTLSFVDNGVAASGTVPTNNSGLITGVLVEPPVSIGASGAADPLAGVVVLTGASAQAMTLAAPIAGAISAGGQDGVTLYILDTSGKAHTVTTPANKINGNKLTATWNATVASNITLFAMGGVWYVVGTANGVTLS